MLTGCHRTPGTPGRPAPHPRTGRKPEYVIRFPPDHTYLPVIAADHDLLRINGTG
jgi:hypothetical protein